MKQRKIPGKRSRTSGSALHSKGDPQAMAGFSTTEKRRLIVLTFGSLIVGASILIGMWKANAEQPRDPLLGEELTFNEVVIAPTIDIAALEAQVRDQDPDQRVVLENEAVDGLLKTTRNLTPGQFNAMGLRELTTEKHAELLAQPSVQRGQPYTVRGWVDDQRTRQRTSGEEHVVRLRLEDLGNSEQRYAYFVAREIPTPLLDNDYLRMDGVFMKVFSDESATSNRAWLEGPLLVGHAAGRSVPAFGPVTELKHSIFGEVEDDSLISPDGLAPNPSKAIPFTPMWNLMAYARDLPADAIDWEAAPLLDRLALEELADQGHESRLRPYRIPLSLLQDVRVRFADENPARIERYTEGWIGNGTWRNVVRFRGPFLKEEAVRQDYVEARGFFLKNFSYLSNDRGIRIAPFFVLHSLDIKHPEPDPIYASITKWVVIGSVLFMAGFVVLVRRNTKHRDNLQEDLLRRRQERRKKRTLQGQAT